MSPGAGESTPEGGPRRILLVRQWDAQTDASTCCGRLGGVTTEFGRRGGFAQERACMQSHGAVYRTLRSRFPDADVTVVDARNLVWLLPAVARDARRRGLSLPAALRQAVRATTPGAVVVDGVVAATETLPPADAVSAVLRATPASTASTSTDAVNTARRAV